jgi:protein-disulfide isomerase
MSSTKSKRRPAQRQTAKGGDRVTVGGATHPAARSTVERPRASVTATAAGSVRTSPSRRRYASARRPRWIAPAVLAGGVVLLAAYLLWPRPHAQPLSAARLAEDPAIGPSNAPITIVEYADFGCPSCLAWYRAGILKQVLSKYGDKVRFVWKDFPVITPESPKAAEAGQCAQDQGKFWPFHDIVYDNAPAIGVDDLKAYAARAGLDTAKFNACLDSGQNKAKVDASRQDAEARGFTGTPSFLLNGKPLAGPPSFAYLTGLIDQALASK